MNNIAASTVILISLVLTIASLVVSASRQEKRDNKARLLRILIVVFALLGLCAAGVLLFVN